MRGSELQAREVKTQGTPLSSNCTFELNSSVRTSSPIKSVNKDAEEAKLATVVEEDRSLAEAPQVDGRAVERPVVTRLNLDQLINQANSFSANLDELESRIRQVDHSGQLMHTPFLVSSARQRTNGPVEHFGDADVTES